MNREEISQDRGKISAVSGIIIILAAFAVIYQPWMLNTRELFWDEGFYASAAEEFSSSDFPVTVVHGIPRQNSGALFPMLIRAAAALTGLGIPLTLRLWSVLMIFCGALISYFAASNNRNRLAGAVAAPAYFGTGLMLDTGTRGVPATTMAAAVMLAQMLFFYFGVRKNAWNRAWLYSFAVTAAGFLACGIQILPLFIVPLIFQRRPVSIKTRLRKPGFFIGAGAAAAAVLWHVMTFQRLSGELPLKITAGISAAEWLRQLAVFPLSLIWRMLPWSIIAWIPFCTALHATDSTPVFSRYLRTLFTATLAILWLRPGTEPQDMLMLCGPLSIMIGINYETAMRRYEWRLRRLLHLSAAAVFIMAGAVLCVCFVPERILSPFVSISLSLGFSRNPEYRFTALTSVIILVMLGCYMFTGSGVRGVWLKLLALALAAGIFHWSVLQPYRSQANEKRNFGAVIRETLLEAGAPILYKQGIADLYGELFYAGVPVKKIAKADEIPDKEPTVFLLSAYFPQVPSRAWSNLMPNGFIYRGHRLDLWKGEIRRDEPADTGGIAGLKIPGLLEPETE